MRNTGSGRHTGLEDDICDVLIGKGFRMSIYRTEPSSAARGRVVGGGDVERRARRIK